MVGEKVDLEKELSDIQKQTADSIAHLQSLGLKLPDEVLDLSEWLTIKRYAEKYGLDIHVVTNWIRRNRIPVDCVKVVSELNDMRLIKDQPYQ